MNYNIDVSPQFSAQLARAAQMRGVDPTKLLETLVAEYLQPVIATLVTVSPKTKYKTPQERIAAMDSVAEKYANAPILPDSAFDRANIYEDKL